MSQAKEDEMGGGVMKKRGAAEYSRTEGMAVSALNIVTTTVGQHYALETMHCALPK